MIEANQYIVRAAFPVDGSTRTVGRLLSERGIDGASVEHGTGYWQGSPEPAIAVTIIHPPSHAAVLDFAADLRVAWDQDEVWVTHEHVGLARVRGRDRGSRDYRAEVERARIEIG